MMVWLNGEWKEEGDAKVASTDRGFLRGEGVFETMLAIGGTVFELGRHWKRMGRGAARFGLQVPSEAEGRAICEELLRRNRLTVANHREHRVRVRVTCTPDHLLMTATPAGSALETTCAKASPYPRNERGALAGIKAISYAENVIAAGEEPLRMESLLENTQGDWCEGTWSNLFAVEAGEVLTPPLSSGCLPGVTREVVIELAREGGRTVREVTKPMSWLTGASELFLTSSLHGVVALTQYNGRAIPHGEITKALSEALFAREAASMGMLREGD